MYVLKCIAFVSCLLLGNKLSAQHDTLPANSGDSAFICLVPDVSEPSFPGGKDSMNVFLKRNLRYPEYAKENNLYGTVYMRFTVETDGKLTGINCVREVKTVPEFAAEAARLIKIMPDWVPATVNGKPIKVLITVPITFRLN
jgi:TonB family protein